MKSKTGKENELQATSLLPLLQNPPLHYLNQNSLPSGPPPWPESPDGLPPHLPHPTLTLEGDSQASAPTHPESMQRQLMPHALLSRILCFWTQPVQVVGQPFLPASFQPLLLPEGLHPWELWAALLPHAPPAPPTALDTPATLESPANAQQLSVQQHPGLAMPHSYLFVQHLSPSTSHLNPPPLPGAPPYMSSTFLLAPLPDATRES
ncbi:hypothetical protein E4T56_gene568 [Termitomyces sp. T112]|nr:hypothetical protein E4T56_gene568 [Termitomyces sp. T112]